jgi:short-subunit dehydrogenase
MTHVLITGTSTGIGKKTALTLARRGHHVIATMRTPAKGEEMAKTAADEGLDLTILALDVNDQSSIDAAVAAAGTIDVLVNNAGIEVRGAIEDCDDDEVQAQFETNVFGLLRVVRAVLPQMRDRGAGVIVNVGSLAGVVTVPYGGIYAASKHAVSAISEALHYECAPFGIRTHVIEPGAFESELQANAITARRYGASSPYLARGEQFQAALNGTLHEGPSPDAQAVADRIATVIDDPAAAVHQPVGADADLIVAVRSSTDFEGFERTMRDTLDWHD